MECVVYIIAKANQVGVAAAVAEVVEVNVVQVYIAVQVVVDMTSAVHVVVVVVVVHEQQRQEGILAKVHGLFITDKEKDIKPKNKKIS